MKGKKSVPIPFITLLIILVVLVLLVAFFVLPKRQMTKEGFDTSSIAEPAKSIFDQLKLYDPTKFDDTLLTLETVDTTKSAVDQQVVTDKNAKKTTAKTALTDLIAQYNTIKTSSATSITQADLDAYKTALITFKTKLADVPGININENTSDNSKHHMSKVLTTPSLWIQPRRWKFW